MIHEILDEEEVLRRLQEALEEKDYINPEYVPEVIVEEEEQEEKKDEESELEKQVQTADPYAQQNELEDKVKEFAIKETESSQTQQSQYDVSRPQDSVYNSNQAPDAENIGYWNLQGSDQEKPKEHDPLAGFSNDPEQYHKNI